MNFRVASWCGIRRRAFRFCPDTAERFLFRLGIARTTPRPFAPLGANSTNQMSWALAEPFFLRVIAAWSFEYMAALLGHQLWQHGSHIELHCEHYERLGSVP